MADIATIGLLQERASREQQVLAEQLQSALSSRVLIEQAKGMFAERHDVKIVEAFTTMRGRSRPADWSAAALGGHPGHRGALDRASMNLA